MAAADLRRISVHRVRRLAFQVLAADFVALAGMGVWLAWYYRPDGGAVSTVHGALGLLAVVAALVAAVATIADGERGTAGLVPAIVILGVVAAIYITGPTLAWDRLSTQESITDPRGTAVVFDNEVGAVGVGGRVMGAGRYKSLTWLHTFALPVSVLSMGAAGVWASRRRQASAATSSSP